MYQFFSVILLVLIGRLVVSQETPPLQCVHGVNGTVDVLYTGEGSFQTYHVNTSASNETGHHIAVCVFEAKTTALNESLDEDYQTFDANNTAASSESLKQTYRVVCEKSNTTAVTTLDINNGTDSDIVICTNTGPPPMDVTTERTPRPFATLEVIDSDGYIVQSVETSQQIRIRVQTLNDKPFKPPIIGKCWYNLTEEGNDGEDNRTMVKSNVMFVEHGCSIQDDTQLIETNKDLFYMNGLMEKVSYPFNLMKLYDTKFDYMQMTCETYYCNEEQSCWARCPPSQTTYQVTGFPLKMNLTTKVFVKFQVPTTVETKTENPFLVLTTGTTAAPAKVQSGLEKIMPYLIIGTLSVTSIILLLIAGLVAKRIIEKSKDDDTDESETPKVFHTNVPLEEIYASPSKEKQKLLDGSPSNQRADLRPVPGSQNNQKYLENLHSDPRQGSGYHSNQLHRNHGNAIPSDQMTRQTSVSTPKNAPGCHANIMSPPPAYLSKSFLRSPQRSQGFVNYGFEEERVNNYHGNRRSDHKDVQTGDQSSPVGGQIYPGGGDIFYQGYRPSRESFHLVKPEKRELRQHRSDTALLNEALREYFDNHGMMN